MTQPKDQAILEAEDAQAREDALDVHRNILLAAPAGSGKTGLLTLRFLCCLIESDAPESVLAITFTNKASNEMRQRIHETLVDALSNEPARDDYTALRRSVARQVLERDRAFGWDLVRNPARIRAMTIDSLNRQIVAVAPYTSGLGGNIPVTDQPALLYQDAVLSLLEHLEHLPAEDELQRAVASVLRLTSNRTDAFVDLLTGLLVRREQWLPLVGGRARAGAGEYADEAPAIVTRLIESEMAALLSITPKTLLDDLAAAAAQGSKASEALARETCWPAGRVQMLPLWRELAASVATTAGEPRKSVTKTQGFEAGTPANKAMKSALENWWATGEAAAAAAIIFRVAALPNPASLEPEYRESTLAIARVLEALMEHLQQAFDRAGAVDFTEISLRALAALTIGAGGAGVLARIDGVVRHLLVDEMQDTSALQYALLRKITEGWHDGDGNSLFFVGDPQQSIYGFRQAEVSLFLQIWEERRFEALHLDTRRLTRNFRSDPVIVEWFNNAFQQVFPRAVDALNGQVNFYPSLPARARAAASANVHFTHAAAVHQSEDEAALALIKRHLAEDESRRVAVLVRNRPNAAGLIALLREARIPFVSQEIDRLLESDAVLDVVNLIRALWHPIDRTAWGAVLRAPFVGLSWADLCCLLEPDTRAVVPDRLNQPLPDALSPEGRDRVLRLTEALDATATVGNGALPERAEALWKALDGPACVNAAEARDIARVFAQLRALLQRNPNADLEDFSRALDALYASSGEGRVEIMTIHKAKGLEFDVVILLGLTTKGRNDTPPPLVFRKTREGLLLSGGGAASGSDHERLFNWIRSMTKFAESAEIDRLLYVAVTRARQHLEIVVRVGSNSRNETVPDGTGPLARALWPAIAALAPANPVASDRSVESEAWRIPVARRLALEWSAPAAQDFIPSRSETLRPSETALNEDDQTEVVDEASRERLVGTLYHETVDFLIRGGITEVSADLEKRIKQSLASGFRRLALPEPEIAGAVDEVVRLTRRTVDSEAGRWILTPGAGGGSELRMSGYRDGRWVSASIDRVIETEGDLWVIDYKTGGLDYDDARWVGYVREAKARYAPQLETYADLVRSERGKEPKKALFFPARGELAVL